MIRRFKIYYLDVVIADDGLGVGRDVIKGFASFFPVSSFIFKLQI